MKNKKPMQDYFTVLGRLYTNYCCGHQPVENRTKTKTFRSIGEKMCFDLKKSFPILEERFIHFKSVVGELLWVLSGDTNAKSLESKYGVTFWREWADQDGELGRIYGYQWRHQRLDQIASLEYGLKHHPFDRGHIISSWNPNDLDEMALRPCHCLAQFFVEEKDGERYLSCAVYQRSADIFLGVPYNIAFYALLTEMLALSHGFKADKLHWFGGDVHLYVNHVDQARELLDRRAELKPLPTKPKIVLCRKKSVLDYEPWDIDLNYYCPASKIEAPVAI